MALSLLTKCVCATGQWAQSQVEIDLSGVIELEMKVSHTGMDKKEVSGLKTRGGFTIHK